MRLTYSEALYLWTHGRMPRPYRTGPGPYDYTTHV